MGFRVWSMVHQQPKRWNLKKNKIWKNRFYYFFQVCLCSNKTPTAPGTKIWNSKIPPRLGTTQRSWCNVQRRGPERYWKVRMIIHVISIWLFRIFIWLSSNITMIIIQGEFPFDYWCGFFIFIWLSSIGRRRAQGCLSIWPLSGGPTRSKDLGCSVQVSVYRSAGGWCDSGWGDGHHATRICCESLGFLKPDVSSLLEAWTRMCLFMLRLGCWVWPWYWPSNGSHSAHRVWRIHFCKCGDLVCSHVFLPDYTLFCIL